MDHLRSCDPITDPSVPVPDPAADLLDPGRAGAADRADGRLEGLDEESLQRLAATRPTIEQAKGMLMAHYGIDADQAFELLSRWSSESHVKVRVLAGRLVDAAAVPDPRLPDVLERLLEQGPSA